MQRREVTTALVLLAVGLLAGIVGRGSAAAEDRAPRQIFLSESRLESLKRRIDERTNPTYTAWRDLKTRAAGLLDRQPHAPEQWYVPGYYRDASGHVQAKQGLQDDANAVYELALCWRMTGDERYAQAAVRLIDGWVNTVRSVSKEDDSTLSFSYHFPAMIFGADLLASWPGFSAERQDAFRRFCRGTALPMILNERWPNDDAAALLHAARPTTARHSAPVLTFTHGDLLEDRIPNPTASPAVQTSWNGAAEMK